MNKATPDVEIDLLDVNISGFEKQEIDKLLKRANQDIHDDLEQIWYLMDLVWDDFQCDNKNPDWKVINEFYEHPVWLLNGLFIEQDAESLGHRRAITTWIVKNNLTKVVDFGGGFGTLAKMVAGKRSDIQVDLFEPHPSQFMIKRIAQIDNVTLIETLNSDYDCLVSTDVLEHVADPLKHFSEMIQCVDRNGYLIIANAFFPMIKCHLPQSFHFRYSFKIFAKIMGLKNIGQLQGSHATIYKKLDNRAFNWTVIRLFERLSKAFYPLINFANPMLRPIKRMVFGD
jgi:2-polyprenyl-6-hydroxyphenyl methylase/3-demethylubiquinone-9 3-methyltransferase